MCSMVCYSVMAQSVEQNISVVTNDGVTLHGSLLLPSLEQSAEPFAVAIIIAGSGPTDRNGNNVMMLNNSLKMLAEGLAERGIASIRYDKRGVAESQNFNLDESQMDLEVFAKDVLYWIGFSERDSRLGEVTLIGHSEGGKIALVACEMGADIAKAVLVATPGRTLDKVLKEQLAHQPPQVKDTAYAIIDSLKDGKYIKEVPIYLNSLFRESVQKFLISDIQTDPSELISRVDVPVLIVQGTTDIQINMRDARALSASNHEAELVIIDNMNHILKDCKSLDNGEQLPVYSNPTIPLSSRLVPAISEFIRVEGEKYFGIRMVY